MAAPFFVQEQPDSSRYRLAAEMAGRNQQPQQPTMNPMAMSKFMQGGGSAAGGAGASPYASMAGGGMGTGGGSAAGSLAGAGPWAALAAAIIGNEIAANEAGRRPEDKKQWAKELITGEVMERDMDYYGDKVGGAGGEIIQGLGVLSNPVSTFKKIKGWF